MASRPRHTPVYAPAPAPVAAVGSPGARLAWPWVTTGLVVLVGAVILIFALSLEERKPVPEEKSGGVETVNLPQDMGPSPGGPTPKTKATPPTPPAVNNPQVIRTYMENGRNFYFGQGGEILNYALAFQWFRKAADLGDPDGQYSVGVMYAAGKGVLEDDSEAVRWYHRAALQGHVAAQLNLGVHYSNGDGVIEDDAEAMNWLLKSALQGNANAQNNIGVMHQNGEGVPRNLINAYAWYNIAAANGHNGAMTSKMEVAALMPADQISRAQALSKALAARIKSP